MSRSIGLPDFDGAIKSLFRFIPCLPSECAERVGKYLAGLFLFSVSLFKAGQQFMDHDGLGFPF